jgi:hypothetical protein
LVWLGGHTLADLMVCYAIVSSSSRLLIPDASVHFDARSSRYVPTIDFLITDVAKRVKQSDHALLARSGVECLYGKLQLHGSTGHGVIGRFGI